MLSPQLVSSLKEDVGFQEFVKYLEEIVGRLDTTDGLSTLTNERAGEEVKVRSQVVVVIHEILKPFINYKEKRQPSDEELKAARERYGL